MSSTDLDATPETILGHAEALLAELVQFASVSETPNGDIVDYFADYLKRHGVHSDIDPNADGTRFNLLASIGPEVAGGIVLSGHTDVVPADPAQWTGDPFVLRRSGDRLIGRGSVDMKGFLACVLAMVPVFKRCEARLERPLHLAFSFDEEVGCFGAAQFGAFFDRLEIKPAIAIIGEPTGMLPIIGHKAGIELITRVRGTSGHASDPRGRVNAIFYAARLIAHIEEVAAHCSERADPQSPFDPAATTLNVGRIEGGEARNVVPDRASFLWEIRPTPPDDGRAIRDGIVAWAKSHLEPEMQALDPGSGIETIELAYCPGMEARPDSPALKLVQRLWTNAGPTVVPFGTDGGHFQSFGMETVVFGPGSMEQMHKPDESITCGELSDGLRFLDRLAHHLCGDL